MQAWSCFGWQKGTSQDEATLSSEEIKPVALAIISLHLSEGIVSQSVNQSVSQSVSQSISRVICLNKKFLKFYINLMEGFMVDLKMFLGSAMPNQCCLDVTK